MASLFDILSNRVKTIETRLSALESLASLPTATPPKPTSFTFHPENCPNLESLATLASADQVSDLRMAILRQLAHQETKIDALHTLGLAIDAKLSEIPTFTDYPTENPSEPQ